MTKRTYLGVFGCCLFLVAGCGGDDDGDAGGGGYNASTRLDALTAEQFSAVCEQFAAYSDQFGENEKRGLCLGLAALAIVEEPDDDRVAQCEALVPPCESSLTPEFIDMNLSALLTGEICGSGAPTNCAVTVGQVDTCLDEGLDALTTVGMNSTCMSLEAEGVLSGASEGATPASCEAVLNVECE